jgi:hypothetical protein
MKKALIFTLYGLLAISIVLTVLAFSLPDNGGVGIILSWTYILAAIAVLAVIIFPLMNIAQNPKAAMRSLIGVGVVIVVIGVSFALSSAEPIMLSNKEIADNPTDLRLTDAGLYTTYFVMVAAIIVTIYGEIRNSLK